MPNPFDAGFRDLDQELDLPSLPVQGKIPDWLAGTLVRTGPGRFHMGSQKVNHWWDGQAMLHMFSFAQGRVSYANKYIRSPDYEACQRTGKMSYSQFAVDPCRTLFQKLKATFIPSVRMGQNTVVNVARVSKRFIAMTEAPIPIEFDIQTLRTIGVVQFDDNLTSRPLTGYYSNGHPHFDAKAGFLYNYVASISPFGTKYIVYQMKEGGMRREPLCEIPTSHPSYMHSFALTDRFLVLVEYPFRAWPVSFMASAMTGDPFITNFRWRPEEGTQFTVIDRNNGTVVARYDADPCFSFHHVNAYEENGEIVLDLCSYPTAAVIQELYLNRIASPIGGIVSLGNLRRYRLPLAQRSGTLKHEHLTDEVLDMPMIDYPRYSRRPYRYTYGISFSKAGEFFDQLIKIDVQERTARKWGATHCYPGEPVFVPAPNAKSEDDGVILAGVLDADQGHSFLLVLDSEFNELGRANVPQAIPGALHGGFFPT